MWNVNFGIKRSWDHIVAIEHAFSVLNNDYFNEQQLNSLEDYMYNIQASVSYATALQKQNS